MAGDGRVASRVRVAVSAGLVAAGLFIGGVGGAIALADPGPGYGRSDDGKGDDSIGDIVRRAFGLGDGNDPKVPVTGPQRPAIRGGSGRPGEKPRDTTTEPTTEPTKEPPTEPTKEAPTSTTTPRPDPPTPPGQPPPAPRESSGGGGGGGSVSLPRFKPPSVPDIQLPDELLPSRPGVPGGTAVLDAGAGIAPAPVGPAVPIALPVIVAPPAGLGGVAGGGVPGGASAGAPPAVPRAVAAEPPAGRSPPPANVGSNVAVPNSSYRIGYPEYLRTAGLSQLAALAVPGLIGILVLTGAGGLVGYRQARAGHAVRVSGSLRFMR